MKKLTFLLLFFTCFAFSQDKKIEKEQQLAIKKSNNLIYHANELMDDNNFISAEKEYRKAISQQSSSVAGVYNLGNSYYKEGNYDEALYRQQQAAKNATEKADKHKAFHNIGNILMKEKRCKEAVEAYKSALRNDPTDDETRYNLGLAKECADQQKDDQPDENQDKDKNKDKKDESDQDKDQQDQKDQDNKDNKDDDKGQDKKDGDNKKDQGKPENEQGKEENQEQKPQPGKLSPQQVKNLLEAMNNQEQKVQEKMNAEKQKGVKIQTEKDW